MPFYDVNAAIDKPNLFETAMRGHQYGSQMRQQRMAEERQNKLAGIASQAYAADPSQRNALVSQAVGVDPESGYQLQTHLDQRDKHQSSMEEQNMQRLRGAAKMMMRAIQTGDENQIQGAHRAVYGFMSSHGQPFPEQFSPEMIPKIHEVLAQTEFLDAGNSELAPRVIGKALVDATGKELYRAPEEQDYKWSDRNGVWIPKPGSHPQQVGQSRVGLDPVRDFPAFAEKYGATVSSLRRNPEKNAAVDGVGNSYHLSGEAGDFEVPADRRQAFIQDAQARGYQAIDEGDHIHVEPPRRGMTQSQFGVGQGLSAIPVAGIEAKQDSQYRLLSEQEVSAAGLPKGTIAQVDQSGKIDIVDKQDAREGTGGVQPLSAGEAAKVRREFKETKDALLTFRALDSALAEIPNDPRVLYDGDSRGRLGTAYNNARAALRIVYNTGVLQPGELPMLESALRDPTSFTAVLDPRSRPQIKEQLNELYRAISRSIDNQVQSYPQIFNQEVYQQRKAGGQPTAARQNPASRQIKRTGMHNGRRVVQYTDGTTEYAD